MAAESYDTFLAKYSIGAGRVGSTRDRCESWRLRTRHLDRLYEEAVVQGTVSLEEWCLVYEAEEAAEEAQGCVAFPALWAMVVGSQGGRDDRNDKAADDRSQGRRDDRNHKPPDDRSQGRRLRGKQPPNGRRDDRNEPAGCVTQASRSQTLCAQPGTPIQQLFPKKTRGASRYNWGLLDHKTRQLMIARWWRVRREASVVQPKRSRAEFEGEVRDGTIDSEEELTGSLKPFSRARAGRSLLRKKSPTPV